MKCLSCGCEMQSAKDDYKRSLCFACCSIGEENEIESLRALVAEQIERMKELMKERDAAGAEALNRKGSYESVVEQTKWLTKERDEAREETACEHEGYLQLRERFASVCEERDEAKRELRRYQGLME